MLRGELDLDELAAHECGLDLCYAYALNNLMGVFLLHTVGDFLAFVNNWRQSGRTRLLQDFLL